LHTKSTTDDRILKLAAPMNTQDSLQSEDLTRRIRIVAKNIAGAGKNPRHHLKTASQCKLEEMVAQTLKSQGARSISRQSNYEVESSLVYQTFDNSHYGSKLVIDRVKSSKGKVNINLKNGRIYGMQQQDARRDKPLIK
jgi:hypothetical protein